MGIFQILGNPLGPLSGRPLVRGLSLELNKSSVVLRCRATRIPAMIHDHPLGAFVNGRHGNIHEMQLLQK